MKRRLLSGTTHPTHKPYAPVPKQALQSDQAGGVARVLAVHGDSGLQAGGYQGIAVSRRLHRKQAAIYIGVSLSWLDKSRLRGDGPAYIEIGGRVVYDTADMDRFMAERRRTSTSRAP